MWHASTSRVTAAMEWMTASLQARLFKLITHPAQVPILYNSEKGFEMKTCCYGMDVLLKSLAPFVSWPFCYRNFIHSAGCLHVSGAAQA
jgi:hypothetical protein